MNTNALTLRAREYNGLAFSFRLDGWLNMTKAAQHFGKDVKDFFSNNSTRECVKLSKSYSGKKALLRKPTRGRFGGTWAHPKLAVFFARWLDVRFAIWLVGSRQCFA